MSDLPLNNRVIDFMQYKRLRDDKQSVDLLEAFENFARSKIIANPMQVIRDMATMHDALREIVEANRRPMPSAMRFDPSQAIMPTNETINIRMEDFERLKRLDAAIKSAQEKIYG